MFPSITTQKSYLYISIIQSLFLFSYYPSFLHSKQPPFSSPTRSNLKLQRSQQSAKVVKVKTIVIQNQQSQVLHPSLYLQLIMNERNIEESRQLAQRMRNGTGAALLLHAEDAPTHRMDSLERFQKDFASYEKMRREDQKTRRQSQLERKRVEVLERENRRWEQVESQQNKVKQRDEFSAVNQIMGSKRVANSNGLAYNPITLQYDRNPQGEKLKRLDQEAKIRGYVRAHNMDHNGNSKYNPLNGEYRRGIEAVIPQDLSDRFMQKKYEHYEEKRLRVPSSASHDQPHPYSKYY